MFNELTGGVVSRTHHRGRPSIPVNKQTLIVLLIVLVYARDSRSPTVRGSLEVR